MTLSQYLNDAGEYEHLTAEDERRYAITIRKAAALADTEAGPQWARAAKKASDKLVSANLLLVVREAKKFINRGLDLEDLIQEGNIGLMKAVTRFDPHRGFRFTTYAMFWIHQSIRLALHEKGRTIRISTNMSERISSVYKAEATLLSMGVTPTISDIAQELDISEEHVEEAFRFNSVTLLSMDYTDEDGNTLADIVPSEENVEESALTPMQNDDLRASMKVLNDRQRKVIEMRYGLTDGEPQSVADIAKELNCSGTTIRKIEAAALKKLRTQIA